MKKISNILNVISVALVRLLGIDRPLWERIRNSPEGRRVLRSAISLVVGPPVFMASFWSGLKIMGVSPLWAFLVATFFTLALIVIDQMLFCAWAENTLDLQPPLLRKMRRWGIPALLIGTTILGLPGWLGQDSQAGLTQAVAEEETHLQQSSIAYRGLKAELEKLQKESEQLTNNENSMHVLNDEISSITTDMKDQKEGNRLRSGGKALQGEGEEYRHLNNLLEEKNKKFNDLKVRNDVLKNNLNHLDAKKSDLHTLEAKLHEQAVQHIGNGVAVHLSLILKRVVHGDIMLGVTALVYAITSLIVDAIVYMALNQAPPTNVAQMMVARTATVAARLHLLAMEERAQVMREMPVVNAYFVQTSVRGKHLKSVPASNDPEAA